MREKGGEGESARDRHTPTEQDRQTGRQTDRQESEKAQLRNLYQTLPRISMTGFMQLPLLFTLEGVVFPPPPTYSLWPFWLGL